MPNSDDPAARRRAARHFEMAMSWRNALGLAQPIFSSKILDVGEFLLIIRDDGVTEGKCLSRNEQVICADWSASLLEPRAQQSVGSICRCLEGQNLKRTKHGSQLAEVAVSLSW